MKISEFANTEILKRYKFVTPNMPLKSLLNKVNLGFHNKLVCDNILLNLLNYDQKNLFKEFLLNKLERVEPEYHMYDTCNLSYGYNNSISFKELCDIVDIDMNKLKKSLTKIYNTHLYLQFIGIGGMNYNILSFWNRFIDELKLKHLYRTDHLRVRFIGDDILEWHNLYRFYDRPNGITNTHNKVFSLYKPLLAPRISNMCTDQYKHFDMKEYNNSLAENVLYIGAVDMNTRQQMSKHGVADIPFISTVHNGNNAFIVTKQEFEGVEVETYGSITVPFLLLNILKLTEFLINYIAELLDKSGGKSENLSQYMNVDEIIFKFNSKDYLINNKAKKHKVVKIENNNYVEAIKFRNNKYDMLFLDNANA